MSIENDITGDVLVALDHELLKEMGLSSTGRRLKLLKLIAELEHPLSVSAEVSDLPTFYLLLPYLSLDILGP
jgi:hypothetical protein